MSIIKSLTRLVEFTLVRFEPEEVPFIFSSRLRQVVLKERAKTNFECLRD
mgnify:CR=1 FL=1